LNLADLLALYDRQQRIDYIYPDMRKEVLPHVTRHLRPAPGMSLVLYSRLDETNASQVIQEQIADFTQMQLPFTWKVYQYDQPADLGERLTRWITYPDELQDVIHIEQQEWGGSFDWIRERMGSHLAIPDYLSVVVAYVDGQPACAGWTYYNLNGEFAGLWGGSTVPEYRNQGLYTAVLAARVQEAIRRGYRFLVVEASMMSREILAKNGFQTITYATSYDWKFEPR
jgi:GNAT superfamily N-acetyltransferase